MCPRTSFYSSFASAGHCLSQALATMEIPAGLTFEEVKRLQRCINDLVSLLAFPAMWSGRSPAEIVNSFADGLLRMLRLDVVYVRLADETGAHSEFLRVPHDADPKWGLTAELLTSFGGDLAKWPRQVTSAGGVALSIESLRLGHGGMGVVVAGSQRTAFPLQTERLLLTVAANQLVLALQEAQLRLEQRRVADELDERVAQRTAELAAINLELRKEIDDRKQAEERLRRSEAFLAEGQNLARIGNFSWLASTEEMKWSEQLYRIFEFEPGMPVTLELLASRFHPEDRSLLQEMIEKARRAASDLEYSCRLLLPDGATKHLQLVAHATRDHQGRLEYLGAVQDVTQRRASEEALTRARTELANVARTTSLGVLTAAIAHEVNQPISAIITNANTCFRLLAAQPPNIDGAVETARRTIRDGKRAADVIARLRTLYTRKDVQPELMDLNEATREVASLSLGELQRNGVVLRHELADDLPPVKGDRIQLQQVILNLLRNASDAMSTINDRPKELLVRTEAVDGDRVRLSVKDAGVGLSAEAAKRIFDPFYTTKSDGMGIGLSVSRSIIEAHYGSLWATPNDGPGVTFAFSLPLESGHARSASPDVGNPPGGGALNRRSVSPRTRRLPRPQPGCRNRAAHAVPTPEAPPA